ncbi:hypothetical protein AC00_3970 [Escherichia coli 1-250-04_S3_C1]|uniref:Uncharacterized protein n=1 Tax=Escherichia coli 1-250-04_S3_C1 TaxID=1444135 RepID=A0AAN4SWS8_ECOLX|nr:hypothetical protein AC00_3970 [Escherichia coli 1-250-04_S3_C1]
MSVNEFSSLSNFCVVICNLQQSIPEMDSAELIKTHLNQ